LKAELFRLGYNNPVLAIQNTLGCCEAAARNKLHGRSDFTIPEAIEICKNLLGTLSVDFAVLFADDTDTTPVSISKSDTVDALPLIN